MIQDMTRGRPFGLLLRFALPLLVGNIFQLCYGIADTAIVEAGQIRAPFSLWAGREAMDNAAIHAIHSEQANFGFADGHVAAKNPAALWDSPQKLRFYYSMNGAPKNAN